MRSPSFMSKVLSAVPSVVVITIIGLGLGTVANLVSPRRIAWIEDWAHHVEARAYREGIGLINTEEAWALFEQGQYLFLDARSEKDYQHSHIPGAFSVPHSAMGEYLQGLQGILTPEQPIIAYCSGLECDESLLLAIELKRMGITNVVLYAGGFQKWVQAGHPVASWP